MPPRLNLALLLLCFPSFPGALFAVLADSYLPLLGGLTLGTLASSIFLYLTTRSHLFDE